MRNFFVNKLIFRTILILFGILMLMFFCIVRLLDISLNSHVAVAMNTNGYTLELNKERGNIYDCNGKKLTGEDVVYNTVFLPCDEAILKFVQIAKDDERERGLECLRNKKPFILKTKNKISGLGIYSYETSERYSSDLGLEHIIGYLNAEGEGIVGVEKAYNDILSVSENTELYFETSALGDFLLGSKPTVSKQKSKGDVYLTIDRDIQEICNKAAEKIKKGSIIVIENQTGKIRGVVSKPGFDVYNLQKYVNSKDSPFLNRSLSAYSVGSVFKPLVAAAMIETEKEEYKYNCVGYIDILGIRFFCNNRSGHGEMDLNSALINSCNTYFYSAASLGKPKIFTEISSILGFGNRIKIAEEIYAASGNVTSLSDLQKSKANIANFSIGQGDIALSPLALSNLYSAISNDGYYFSPQLVEGYTQNGEYYKTKPSAKTIAFSKSTALQLRQSLINAVTSGTGKNANPENCTAGGKTATAQTGRLNGDKEILNAWFCGFFPEQNPKYVIVVLAEEATSGGGDAAPIFKKIVEEITMISQK